MKTEVIEQTWEDLVAIPEGTILKDWFDDGVRCLIIRGPGSLCAYFGVPTDHPLAGFGYDDLPIDCHGGLTFSGEGDGSYRPKGFYWYGLDYAHLGDYCFYYDKYPTIQRSDDKKWLVDEVEKDLWWPINQFRRLMKLAERIKR